uniref:Uncharacterized protein n=1 Tax=Plectus sambesii TaxID=2011161 RepID=A0A914UZ66_9BILA
MLLAVVLAATAAAVVNASYSAGDHDVSPKEEIADWEVVALWSLGGCLLLLLIAGTLIAFVIKRNEINRRNYLMQPRQSPQQQLPLVQTLSI